jgi:phosphoribosylformylglycinamidine synthase
LFEDVNRYARALFPEEGLVVALLGRRDFRQRASDLAGSEYLQVIHGLAAGRPFIDLSLERRVQKLCRDAIQNGLINSAHDCSEGGLAVALAECCVPQGVGFTAEPRLPRRWDAAMFGEGQSRIVVALSPERWEELEAMAAVSGVPLLRLGTTGGDRFRWGPLLDLPVGEISDAWRHGLRDA